ncbi:MAG: long-chain acyl-CoA synthetase [Sphingomonadales bacterium]|nr:long-chain acyl-CoA synthetase [Sphingomonadales bacterium]
MAAGSALPIRAARALRSRNKGWVKVARQLERFDNLIALFLTRVAEKGDAPFLWAKREGQWRPISWADAARQVASLAASLKRIGLEPGDRVALVSENRPEWLISDLAIMAAGCVTVPTYTTNTERDHAHVLGNSGARAVIVSNQKLAKNLIPAVSTLSSSRLAAPEASFVQ